MDGRQQDSWMSARGQGLEPDDTEWPPTVDTTVAHPARRYDYWLGGKDNFAADRESGDAIAAAFPTVRTAVIENWRFVRRAVAFLAGHAGIQQFLDIGTGIPTSPNVHEIAQATAPASRVVYVDNDHHMSGCAHAGTTVGLSRCIVPFRPFRAGTSARRARALPQDR